MKRQFYKDGIAGLALADSGHNYSSAAIGPSTTPIPAALPLFASGLGALGLLGWRRKRKNVAAIAA
jgi:hypothetical protein